MDNLVLILFMLSAFTGLLVVSIFVYFLIKEKQDRELHEEVWENLFNYKIGEYYDERNSNR